MLKKLILWKQGLKIELAKPKPIIKYHAARMEENCV
jgi:hypothetical protein